MDRYKNKYRSESVRLENWDYGSPGYYYVTICTKKHKHYFGEVIMAEDLTSPWEEKCGGIAGTHNYASLPPTAHAAHGAIVQLTRLGHIAFENWINIPKHFPFVKLDEFVIMPNHLHGLLCFQKAGYRERNVNRFGPQSKNLASVVRNYKSATKAYATSHDIEFHWQPRYHDDVVTSGKELDNIREYIRNNPKRWMEKNSPRRPVQTAVRGELNQRIKTNRI
jgi:putative transposase